MKSLFTIQGTVIHGKSRGKALGFPTANIDAKVSISPGIYTSDITVKNKAYHAATFIGSAQTFDETEQTVETYILDFDQDIYGEEVSIALYKKLRENKKFDSVEKLIDQIKEDVRQTRLFFKQ